MLSSHLRQWLFSSDFPRIESALYRLLTFQVPILMSLFRCLVGTKVSVQVHDFVGEYFVTKIRFGGDELLAPHPTPKLEDNPLSAVRYLLFNIFAATFYVRGRSSIRNLRTRHAVVTGTLLHHTWTNKFNIRTFYMVLTMH
jgi:hypothetical protein